MSIVGIIIRWGVPTIFVAEIAQDKNKSFVFCPSFRGGWHNTIGIWLEGKSRLPTNETPKHNHDITQNPMILTPEGRVTVADRASAFRYDITVEKKEKAEKVNSEPGLCY